VKKGQVNQTLVIMPTYNERSNIVRSIEQLFKFNPEVQLLVVDDNSPDGTADLVLEAMGRFKNRLFLLQRPNKAGLGPAYLAGFNWAFERGYWRVVEMDADGSHRAEDLPRLLEESEFDLVIGSRWIPGGKVINWPIARKLVSQTGNLYARLLLKTDIRDMTAGFRVYKVDLLKRLPLERIASQGYSFQVEMTFRSIAMGANSKEVAITFVEREHGVSKMNTAIVLEALWLVTRWGVARLLGKNI
jgi:glycosyltransferase involved in cell wall biosynthesis